MSGIETLEFAIRIAYSVAAILILTTLRKRYFQVALLALGLCSLPSYSDDTGRAENEIRFPNDRNHIKFILDENQFKQHLQIRDQSEFQSVRRFQLIQPNPRFLYVNGVPYIDGDPYVGGDLCVKRPKWSGCIR